MAVNFIGVMFTLCGLGLFIVQLEIWWVAKQLEKFYEKEFQVLQDKVESLGCLHPDKMENESPVLEKFS